MGEQMDRRESEDGRREADGAAAVKDRQICPCWRVIKENWCAPLFPFRTQVIYIRREIPTEWKKRKVCQFLKVQQGRKKKKNALLNLLPACQIALSNFPSVIQNPYQRISPEVSQI